VTDPLNTAGEAPQLAPDFGHVPEPEVMDSVNLMARQFRGGALRAINVKKLRRELRSPLRSNLLVKNSVVLKPSFLLEIQTVRQTNLYA
jgi:hypothetical protein